MVDINLCRAHPISWMWHGYEENVYEIRVAKLNLGDFLVKLRQVKNNFLFMFNKQQQQQNHHHQQQQQQKEQNYEINKNAFQ